MKLDFTFVNDTQIPGESLLPLILWTRTLVDDHAHTASVVVQYRKNSGKYIAGRARAIAAFDRTSGVPANRPLVRIQVGPSWQDCKYPLSETYKKRAGALIYNSWQEHFVAYLAHELRHIEQYGYGRQAFIEKHGSLEIDAEHFARFVLAEFRKQVGPMTQALSHAARVVETKECPACHRSGDVASVFGYRKMAGKLRPQSYCHTCRKLHARGYNVKRF